MPGRTYNVLIKETRWVASCGIFLACAVVAGGFLSGCAADRELCGVSFCANNIFATFVEKNEGPDFDIYIFEVNGRRFTIYEGNHPLQQGRVTGQLPPSSGVDSITELAGQVEDVSYKTLRVKFEGTVFPQFLDISTECDSADDCGLVEFLDRLYLRG